MQLFLTAKKSNGEEMSKTKLLFVLRDHVTSPLSKLSEILAADVRKIWNAIDKPKEMSASSVEDFFDLDFFSLPHKNLAADAFMEAGAQLKKTLQSGSYFDLETYNRGLEADGLALYAENVWKTIMSNKELDIPSQREMVSVVRCDEALASAFKFAQAELGKLEAERKPIVSLDERILCIFGEAKDVFQKGTVRQLSKVSKRKELDLEARLGTEIVRVVLSQMDFVTSRALETFREKLQQLRDRDEAWTDFGKLSNAEMTKALSDFDSACKAPQGISAAELKTVVAREAFERDLLEELKKTQSEVLIIAETNVTDAFSSSVKTNLVPVVDAAESLEMWMEATEIVRAALEEVDISGHKLLGTDGVGLTEKTLGRALEQIQSKCLASVVDEVKRVIGGQVGILRRMKQRFTQLFRFDDSGHPRVWAPRDNVAEIFEIGRAGSCKIADILSTIQLHGLTEEELFDEGVIREMKQQLENEASVAFVDARHAQELARMQTKIPIWAVLLFGVLGYDEAKQVIYRPRLFFSLLFAFLVLCFIYYFGLHEIVLIPLRSALMPVLHSVRDFVAGFIDGNAQEGAEPSGQTPPSKQETLLDAKSEGDKKVD